MPAGRPKEDRAKRQPVIEAVLLGIEQGIPLAEICRRDGFPDRRNIYVWMEEDAQFASRFAIARERGFDVIAEEAMAIADGLKPAEGLMTGADEMAPWMLAKELATRDKLRVETRLKLLAKWDPKRYGERQQVEQTVKIENMTAAEIDAKIKAMLGD